MTGVKINWKAVLLVIAQIGGLASHPEIFNLLPEWAAIMISVCATIGQAVTNPAVRIPVERRNDP